MPRDSFIPGPRLTPLPGEQGRVGQRLDLSLSERWEKVLETDPLQVPEGTPWSSNLGAAFRLYNPTYNLVARGAPALPPEKDFSLDKGAERLRKALPPWEKDSFDRIYNDPELFVDVFEGTTSSTEFHLRYNSFRQLQRDRAKFDGMGGAKQFFLAAGAALLDPSTLIPAGRIYGGASELLGALAKVGGQGWWKTNRGAIGASALEGGVYGTAYGAIYEKLLHEKQPGRGIEEAVYGAVAGGVFGALFGGALSAGMSASKWRQAEKIFKDTKQPDGAEAKRFFTAIDWEPGPDFDAEVDFAFRGTTRGRGLIDIPANGGIKIEDGDVVISRQDEGTSEKIEKGNLPKSVVLKRNDLTTGERETFEYKFKKEYNPDDWEVYYHGSNDPEIREANPIFSYGRGKDYGATLYGSPEFEISAGYGKYLYKVLVPKTGILGESIHLEGRLDEAYRELIKEKGYEIDHRNLLNLVKNAEARGLDISNKAHWKDSSLIKELKKVYNSTSFANSPVEERFYPLFKYADYDDSMGFFDYFQSLLLEKLDGDRRAVSEVLRKLGVTAIKREAYNELAVFDWSSVRVLMRTELDDSSSILGEIVGGKAVDLRDNVKGLPEGFIERRNLAEPSKKEGEAVGINEIIAQVKKEGAIYREVYTEDGVESWEHTNEGNPSFVNKKKKNVGLASIGVGTIKRFRGDKLIRETTKERVGPKGQRVHWLADVESGKVDPEPGDLIINARNNRDYEEQLTAEGDGPEVFKWPGEGEEEGGELFAKRDFVQEEIEDDGFISRPTSQQKQDEIRAHTEEFFAKLNLPAKLVFGVDEEGGAGGAVNLAKYESKTGTITVYPIALSSKRLAEKMVLHEGIGHYAFEHFLGDQKREIFNLIDQSTDPLVLKVRAQIKDRYPEDQLSREIVAKIAEENPQNTVIQRIVAAIRRFLRSLGLGIAMSYNDIVDALRRARKKFKVSDDVESGTQHSKRKAFYSQLKRTLEGVGPKEKLTGKQWLRRIRSQKSGVLEAEVRANRYLVEKLEAKANEVVGKDEVLGLYGEGAPRIREITYQGRKGEEGPLPSYERVGYKGNTYSRTGELEDYTLKVEGQEHLRFVIKQEEISFRATRFQGFLYEKDTQNIDGGLRLITQTEKETLPETAELRLLNFSRPYFRGAEYERGIAGEAQWPSYQQRINDPTYREILVTNESGQFPSRLSEIGSEHFAIENLVVYLRVSDYEIEGRGKILQIEEIQSDLHQKTQKREEDGRIAFETKLSLMDKKWEFDNLAFHRTRKEILSQAKKPQKEAVKELEDLLRRRDKPFPKEFFPQYDYLGALTPKEFEVIKTALELIKKDEDYFESMIDKAGFRGSNQWVKLALKRAINIAVTEGYDGIQWPSGQNIRQVVGGAPGLAKFYDENIFRIANNLLKKNGWGKVEVRDESWPGDRKGTRIFPVTDKMISDVLGEGQPLFARRHMVRGVELEPIETDELPIKTTIKDYELGREVSWLGDNNMNEALLYSPDEVKKETQPGPQISDDELSPEELTMWNDDIQAMLASPEGRKKLSQTLLGQATMPISPLLRADRHADKFPTIFKMMSSFDGSGLRFEGTLRSPKPPAETSWKPETDEPLLHQGKGLWGVHLIQQPGGRKRSFFRRSGEDGIRLQADLNDFVIFGEQLVRQPRIAAVAEKHGIDLFKETKKGKRPITGRAFYDAMKGKFGGAQSASEVLRDEGVFGAVTNWGGDAAGDKGYQTYLFSLEDAQKLKAEVGEPPQKGGGKRYAIAHASEGDIYHRQKRLLGKIYHDVLPQHKELFKQWKIGGGDGNQAEFNRRVGLAFMEAGDGGNKEVKTAAKLWEDRVVNDLVEEIRELEETKEDVFPIFSTRNEKIKDKDIKRLFTTFIDRAAFQETEDAFRQAYAIHWTEYMQERIKERQEKVDEAKKEAQEKQDLLETASLGDIAKIQEQIRLLPENLQVVEKAKLYKEVVESLRSVTGKLARPKKDATEEQLDALKEEKEGLMKQRKELEKHPELEEFFTSKAQLERTERQLLQGKAALEQKTKTKLAELGKKRATAARALDIFGEKYNAVARRIERAGGQSVPVEEFKAIIDDVLENVDELEVAGEKKALMRSVEENKGKIQKALADLRKARDIALRRQKGLQRQIEALEESVDPSKTKNWDEVVKSIWVRADEMEERFQNYLESKGAELVDGRYDLSVPAANRADAVARALFSIGLSAGREAIDAGRIKRSLNKALVSFDWNRTWALPGGGTFRGMDILQTDITAIGTRFMQNVGGDMILWDALGTINPLDLNGPYMKKINEEFLETVNAGPPKDGWNARLTQAEWKKKVTKWKNGLLSDLYVQLERARHLPREESDPTTMRYKGMQSLRAATTLNMGGSMTLASFSDPAQYFSMYAFRPWKRMAEIAWNREAKNALKMTREEAHMAGAAIETMIFSNKFSTVGTGDAFHGHGRFENLPVNTRRWMGRFNLLPHFTQVLKQLGSYMAVRELGDALTAVYGKTNLTEKQVEWKVKNTLLRGGLDEEIQKRIWDQMSKPGGSTKVGRAQVPNPSAWTDVGARRAFQAAMSTLVDLTTMTPGRTSLPGLVDNSVFWRTVFTFRQFGLSAMTKLVMRARQDVKEVPLSQMFAFVLGTFLGGLSSIIRVAARGDLPLVPKTITRIALAGGAIYGGYLVGLFGESLTVSSRIPATDVLGSDPVGRNWYGMPTDALLGPSMGIIRNGLEATAEAAHTPYWVRPAMKMAPGYNLPYAKWLYDETVDHAEEGMEDVYRGLGIEFKEKGRKGGVRTH